MPRYNKRWKNQEFVSTGLIRGCGFALPPGTFGLDFIIPVLLNFQDSTRRPNYSYIGIQVKTIAESFYTEVAKTALPFVIEKCLKHMECVDRNHHSGCMSDEEYEEIIANQLTLIMCMDRDNVANRVKGSFYSAKPQVSSSLKRTRWRMRRNNRRVHRLITKMLGQILKAIILKYSILYSFSNSFNSFTLFLSLFNDSDCYWVVVNLENVSTISFELSLPESSSPSRASS